MKLISLNIFLFILMLSPQKLWSQEIAVSSKLDTNFLLIGDQTYIHLELSQPKSEKVYWPIITDKIGEHVDMLSFSDLDTTFLSNNKIKIGMDILITSFDTGYVAIPPFEFKYNIVNDTSFNTARTSPLLLAVFPLRVDLKKGITDIKPIIDEPFTIRELYPYILWTSVVVLLALLGIYIWIRIKNNKPIISLHKKPLIPPHIIANDKLDKLKAKKLWQNGFIKEFYSELTDILRYYMEGRFGFGAMEMISDDIIKNLKEKDIEKDLVEDAEKLLLLADFAKFAKVQPLADEIDWALKWAYSFIDRTTSFDKDVEKEEEGEL